MKDQEYGSTNIGRYKDSRGLSIGEVGLCQDCDFISLFSLYGKNK